MCFLGGANSSWYDRPLAWWIRRPVIRRTSRLSSIPNSMTASKLVLLFFKSMSNYGRKEKRGKCAFALSSVKYIIHWLIGEPCRRGINECKWGNRICKYLFSLNNGSRETVQKESVLALGLVQVRIDHIYDQIIRDKLAIVHDLLDLSAQLRTGLNFGSQHVTGGQVAHAVLFLQNGSLDGRGKRGIRNTFNGQALGRDFETFGHIVAVIFLSIQGQRVNSQCRRID